MQCKEFQISFTNSCILDSEIFKKKKKIKLPFEIFKMKL